MSKRFVEDKKKPAYFLTLYKLEGHTTWRANLGGDEDHFNREIKTNWKNNAPKVTEKRIIKIDRLTGTIT